MSKFDKQKVAEVGTLIGAVACGTLNIVLQLQRNLENLSKAVGMLQSGMQFAGQLANNFCTSSGAEIMGAKSAPELVQPIQSLQETGKVLA